MNAMAQEGSEASDASSASAANNSSGWDFNVNSLLSWHALFNHCPQKNHNSSSSCDEDISISNTTHNITSNHSMDSSSGGLSGDQQVEHQLWSQVLLNIGNSGEIHSRHENGENKFVQMLNSRNQSTQSVYEPAYDYLNKLDGNWEFASPSSLMSSSITEPERLTNNLSTLVNNWSIALPSQQLDHQNIAPTGCNVSNISPPFQAQQFPTSTNTHIKHEVCNSSSQHGAEMAWQRSKSYEQQYSHRLEGENSQQYRNMKAPTFFSHASPMSIGIGNQSGHGSSSTSGLNQFYVEMHHDVPNWSSSRSLTDHLSLSECLKKPGFDLGAAKLNGSDSSSSMNQRQDRSVNNSIHKTRANAKASNGTPEGKKKRSEECSDALHKKSKSDGLTTPIIKTPKVKLGDKITALQQLVSPFGKTDTASVLYETINSIRILQEQVQLLCDPYLKINANKDHSPHQEMETRNDKQDQIVDLRSKGLCLIPISRIHPAHKENNGPDYWMPTYRSCLYR